MNDQSSRLAIPLIPAARLGSSTWLLHLRYFAVAGQLVAIVVAVLIGIELQFGPLLAFVAFTAITNFIYGVYLRTSSTRLESDTDLNNGNGEFDTPTVDDTPTVRAVTLGLMLLDLMTLTAMLYFSGGPTNPFSFFYFVNLAVGGVMIWPRAAWSMTAVAIVGYSTILLDCVHVPELGPPVDENGFGLRSIGLMLAFATCASVVTYFVTRTSGSLRAREKELRESQLAKAANRRIEALTTLAAGAAHELATPLSTIDVISRELSRHLEGVEKPESVAEDLRLIDHQLELCRHILHRMRGAAGDTMAQQWYKTTVGDLIDATLEGVRDPHRVDVIDGTEDDENRTLWMPEEAVAQAIRNLIHNGLDASGVNGRVKVESRIDEQYVEFLITDEGQGMTDEILGRIGDPFFTTKEPGRGIGLGLYLTRNVVSQLGGSLTFSSIPGRGTSAVVKLPIANPENAPNVPVV